MDFIEGLPLSEGHDMILVIVCRLTKMALFIPTYKTATSIDLAKLFLRNVFSKHGVPQDIVSDRGRHFVSNFWSSLCDHLRIKSNLSTAYHPETDGQTERVNQILEQYLRFYVNYEQDDWVSLLPLAEFAYNNTSHSATGVSPFFANKGYNPQFEVSVSHISSFAAEAMVTSFSELNTHLQDQIGIAIKQYATATESRRLPIPPFAPGDLVWLDARNIKTLRPSKKLDNRRLGPFKILSEVSSHARKLELPLTLKRIHPVFHVSLLEPDFPNPFPLRSEPPPIPILLGNDLEYEVQQVLNSKRANRAGAKLVYLVQWKGYEGTAEEYSWEPVDNLENASELIEEFHQAYPEKPGPPRVSG